MNQDAALDKWIEEDMRNVPCVMPVDEVGEYMCREAWFAAVRHTLEHVASELRARAEECYATDLLIAKDALREQACRVLKMEP